MKIDTFFKRQPAKPDAQAQKLKSIPVPVAKCAEQGFTENDTQVVVDVGPCAAAEEGGGTTVDKLKATGTAATNMDTVPLMEATNKQPQRLKSSNKHIDKHAGSRVAVDLRESPSADTTKPVAQDDGQGTPNQHVGRTVTKHAHGTVPTVSDFPALAQQAVATTPAPASPLVQLEALGDGAGTEATPLVNLQAVNIEVPPPSCAVNTSTVKVPQEAFLTPEERMKLLQQCLQELPQLAAELDKRPDFSSHVCLGEGGGSKKASHKQDMKYQVSLLVEGQSLPLSQLAQHISNFISSNGMSSAVAASGVASSQADAGANTGAAAGEGSGCGETVSALIVRNIIQDVASRKSYGLQDGALAPVDAFEDVTDAYHWCWELRSLTGLAKFIKQQVDAARKHRKQLLDRMKACSAFVQLAQGFTKSTKTAEAKIAKAAAKLSKLPSCQELLGAAPAEANQVIQLAVEQTVAVETQAEDVQQTEADKAAKEAETEAKEAAKAAKAAAKAAEAEEKARQKAEEAKKREEARQQKAAEEARKKEEKAKQKEEKKVAAQAAKKGFQSAQEMQKSRNMFMSFLKREPRPPTLPAGPSGDNSQGGSCSQQQQQQQQEMATTFTPAQAAAAGRVWALPSGGPTAQQLTSKQQLDQLLPCCSGVAAQPPPELLRALVHNWKEVGKQHSRIWGLPPSWAQRPGAVTDHHHIAATAEALYGEGVDLGTLRRWRRKLIKHHDSVRPPYYGSWSRRSSAVRGRKPFGQDVELDYEVMSDQDWEEEPEGESLSDDAEDDEEPAGDDADEDEEGFVVGDGYLSDDEGLKDEDGDTVMLHTASTNDDAELDPIEAAQERAKARGRFVVLGVNELAPALEWEPTTNLDPSLLLSSLQPTIFCPELAPLQPWEQLAVQVHGGRPPSAALAAPATAADITFTTPTAAGSGSAAAVAASGGASGPGRRHSVFPDDMLGALLQHIQANSALNLDKLTDQFVESLHGACLSGKLTKKCVRDKIKEVAAVKKGRTPSYAVKPEYLAMLGTSAGSCAVADQVPSGVWGVRYKEDTQPAAETQVAQDAAADAAVDMMQIDGVNPACEHVSAPQQQEQELQPAQQKEQQQTAPQPVAVQQEAPQQQSVQEVPKQTAEAAAAVAALPAQVSGVKRPASAGPSDASPDRSPTHQTKANAQDAQQQQQDPQAQLIASAGPPAAKKLKTPGGGIERFFTKSRQRKQVDQQQQQQQAGGIDLAAQHQQASETPPSTPRCSGAEECQDAAAKGTTAGLPGTHSGVLPMLTPPSIDDAAERPSLPHSPVPFRMNSADEADAAEQVEAEQQEHQQRAPINRWHAQADCRGMSLQGGSTSSMPQQQGQQQGQQQSPQGQPSAGLTGQQQQSPSVGFVSASTVAAAAGAPAAADGGRAKWAAPQLPEDGSAPDGNFWKQLATWIVCVKEPSQSDITAAFAVFDEKHLKTCIHNMPQSVVSTMVKTLGSISQSFPMRAACARCISNVAQCLATTTSQLQQHVSAATSTPVKSSSLAAAESTPVPSPSPAAAAQATPSSVACRRLGASPSPSNSPRSAPVTVSFEELCAEPGLLNNLQLSAIDPSNLLRNVQDKLGSGFSGTLQEALELSRCSLRAAAALTGVGLPHPLSGSKEYCQSAAAAAAEVRVRMGSTPSWRGTLIAAVHGGQNPDRLRGTYGLMALYSLLSDTQAASQLVSKDRMAKLIAQRVLHRGAHSPDWVIQKWSLLVASMLLSDELFQGWVLPQDGLSQFHQHQAADETVVEGMGLLVSACLNRPSANITKPGPDQIIVGKSLTLTSLLVTVLGQQVQLPGNNGRLPGKIANLVGSGFAGGDAEEGVLVTALREVAMQEDWEEAAARARRILDSLETAVASKDIEMQDAAA